MGTGRIRVGQEETVLRFQPILELEIERMRVGRIPSDVIDGYARDWKRMIEAIYESGFVDAHLCAAVGDDARCTQQLREIGSRFR